MTADTPWISLADFAATFHEHAEEGPPSWATPQSLAPLPEQLGFRTRLEDVLDTVVALQRADWLQDGVYVGPQAMGEVYRSILDCSRTLRIAVPPAIMAGCALRSQGAFGTDARAFLYLSTFFFNSATDAERRFMAGRLCGHIAARQVTANTLYALIVDHNGLRGVARRSVGPLLEVVLAPLSLAAKLALSRWHRAAEISADRAGMLCAGDWDASGRSLLRIALGVKPNLDVEAYLEQLRAQHGEGDPGKWTELLSAQPWMHKRIKALTLFAHSELWAEAGHEVEGTPLTVSELNQRTATLLGVS